ncbi:hypothetical protein ACQCLI_14245 [Pseudomonas nitroreducens]|uniref:hypothetical protein n=1 Tax=Pseudomonas TaxID=286 RepID=UPI0012FD54F3|nr:hypothetical protein [Pseudomonas nitroreducens]
MLIKSPWGICNVSKNGHRRLGECLHGRQIHWNTEAPRTPRVRALAGKSSLGIAIANAFARALLPESAQALCGQHEGTCTTTQTCSPASGMATDISADQQLEDFQLRKVRCRPSQKSYPQVDHQISRH